MTHHVHSAHCPAILIPLPHDPSTVVGDRLIALGFTRAPLQSGDTLSAEVRPVHGGTPISGTRIPLAPSPFDWAFLFQGVPHGRTTPSLRVANRGRQAWWPRTWAMPPAPAPTAVRCGAGPHAYSGGGASAEGQRPVQTLRAAGHPGRFPGSCPGPSAKTLARVRLRDADRRHCDGHHRRHPQSSSRNDFRFQRLLSRHLRLGVHDHG